MPITDSRQGPGTLSLGSTDYGVQISNVRLVPTHDTTDGTKTLGEPNPAPLLETSWALEGTAVQDWENDAATGFVEYCRTTNGTTVAFEWVPNAGGTVKYSGTCQVVAVEFGGAIGEQTTTDFTFSVVGDITRDTHTPLVSVAKTTATK